MKKIKLTILPENSSRVFDENTLLVDALSEMGVVVKTPCGGKGFCGKCGIRAEGGLSDRSSADEKFFHGNISFRLACQARLTGDATAYSTSIRRAPAVKFQAPAAGADLGLAVDIGTTTIQVSLVDMAGRTGHLLDSFLNPQRRFGHDVIARISVSADPESAEKLVSSLRISIARSAADALAAAGIDPAAVTRIIFSGNTTMLYFLFGLDPRPLGVFPYRAPRIDFHGFAPGGIGFGTFRGAAVEALPAASAYLGGDLIGGLALTHDMGYRNDVFFIDLGTNGEIFLRNGGGDIYSTSCAMGPALEGMNITSGMTADDGAIAHVSAADDALHLDVIGNTAPEGICGTGIVDAVAILLEKNILRRDGAFNPEASGFTKLFPGGIISRNGTKAVMLADEVALTQRDIRNIQLAKGASLSASHILLKEAACDAGSIRDVFIAGAFGQNLDIGSFRALGFIPDFGNAEYHFLGNSSLASAEKACYDPGFRSLARELRDAVRVIELSAHPDFQEEFVKCLNF
jgi:uncharacterized 2Fe-2S/4Fe-4S cluster protein (DUF4445 family)